MDTHTDKRAGAPPAEPRGRTGADAEFIPTTGHFAVATPGVFDYLRIVYRHRWLALACFVCTALPVIAFGLLQTPAYEARARLVLDAEPSVPITFEDAGRRAATGPDARTQEEVLRSRDLVRRTILSMRLWERPGFNAFSTPSLMTRMRRAVGLEATALAAAPASTTKAAAPAEPPTALAPNPAALAAGAGAGTSPATPAPGLSPNGLPGAPKASVEDEQRADAIVALMVPRIKVNAIPLSRLIDVVFEAPDAKIAADFVNELARQFIRQDVETRVLASRRSSVWLEERLEEQRRKVEADDAALQQYKEQQNALSVEDRQNIVVQSLADLNAAVTKARTERLSREGSYRQVEQNQTNPTALASLPALAANASIQALRTQLGEAQRKQNELSQKYGEKHPEMIAARGNIENAETRLRAEVTQAAEVIKNEYLAALTQEQSLQRALNGQKEDALRVNRQGLEYGRLQRAADTSRQIYQSLLQQAQQVDIAGEFKQSAVRVIESARTPGAPVRPERVKFAAFGLATGLFLALGVALGWEFMDPRIKTPAQIQEYLQLPFIGLIPATKIAAGEERPQFAQGHGPSPFADALRRVRANLRLAAPGPGPHILLITSSAPREGKTTVSVGLAHCFAIATPRVLLIDADLRRPSVHRTLHVKSRKGLAEYLASKADVNDVIQQTSFENLSVIPAGHIPENPSELLGLPRMAALLEAVRDRFDWVLIDTAPVLSAPDAEQLASLATGILFVVGAEMTSRDDVQRAERELMRARVPFAGSVLNRAQVEKHGYYYAPYYNKAYESYYQSPTSDNS